jgi:fused signal recognition particle receptor
MGLFTRLFRSDKKRIKQEKYKIGMAKTRSGVLSNLKQLLASSTVMNDDFFDELEEIFIMADIGVNTVVKIVDHLRHEVEVSRINNVEDLKETLIDQLFKIYIKDEIVSSNLDVMDGRVNVVLFVGVNGVGKTTTIAKVAHEYKKRNKKILMVAGDTFRAGAINQLKIWAQRVGVEFFSKKEGSDPSSVMFDAIQYAKDNNIDLILCDTAGRLQNKKNLMMELEKIHKVISREIDGAPHETLLVVDATTGQNGLTQAQLFNEVTNISGIVLTKLDGTAKGGIVLAIRDELGIPIKYIGLGEKMDDLEHFDIEEYIYGMFEGIF